MSGDLISREETLTAFADYVGSGMSMNDYDALWDIVVKMPAVNPQEPYYKDLAESYERTINKLTKAIAEQEPKTGRWIAVGDSFWKCSECRCCEISKSNWCPNCGAKMESDHKCHTCKHYMSGEQDGSCDSYICEGYSDWEDKG